MQTLQELLPRLRPTKRLFPVRMFLLAAVSLPTADVPADHSIPSESSAPDAASAEMQELPDLPDVTLTDQYGNTHSFSDYKGKTIFLNF